MEISKSLGYLRLKPGTEIRIDQIKNFKDRDLTLVIAGSQGQENSAMTRISNGEHREVKLGSNDVVIFSADPIPGNEISVYELVDTIVKKDVRVVYSSNSSDFHVSGHGSQDELSDLIKMVKPKKLIPIGGTPRHMYAYKNMAMDLGYKREDVLLLDDGQEVIFGRDSASFGKIVPLKNVYVDEVSGEEMESFVLRDRQKLSEGGIVIILAQVSSSDGQLVDNPGNSRKKNFQRFTPPTPGASGCNRGLSCPIISLWLGVIGDKNLSSNLRKIRFILFPLSLLFWSDFYFYYLFQEAAHLLSG